MIPNTITDYLSRKGIAFHPVQHPHFESARELADHMGIEDDQIAKAVLLMADGDRWLAVVPAYARVDLRKVAEELDANQVRVLPEEALRKAFPDCELGAEPALGGHYGIPMILDESFTNSDEILLRGGTFEDSIELRVDDLRETEQPNIAPISQEQPHDQLVSHHIPVGPTIPG